MTFRRHESISSLAFIDPLYIQWGDTRGNTRDALNHWNLCTTGGEEEGRREGDPLRAVSFTFHYGIICHASVDPLSLADHKQPWHKFQLSRITWRRSIDRPATEKFITLKSTDRDAREMRAPPTSVSLLQWSSFLFFLRLRLRSAEWIVLSRFDGDVWEDWEDLEVWIDVMKSWTTRYRFLFQEEKLRGVYTRDRDFSEDWRGWIRKYDFPEEELKLCFRILSKIVQVCLVIT